MDTLVFIKSSRVPCVRGTHEKSWKSSVTSVSVSPGRCSWCKGKEKIWNGQRKTLFSLDKSGLFRTFAHETEQL